jgi:hypothetical protein
MSELAVRPTNGWGLMEPTSAAPAPAAPSLSDWVEQAREVATVADMLCRTAFVPKAFLGKPAECAAAILAGQEMGMSPMASLRAIDVIEGKPGLTALGLRALVQSKGHEIWTHESTATRAIVKGRRRGSDKVETSTWTLDRAKTFGLLGKKNWREQPTSMLLARATAECARLIAADALLGMPYSTEELADGADSPAPVSGPPAEPRTTARRTARRAQPAPAPAPAPVADPEPDLTEPGVDPDWSEPTGETEPEEPTAPAEEGINEAQKKKLHTAFTAAGIKARDQKIELIERVVGRRVGSSTELTKREAIRVIDHVEGLALPVEEPEPGFDDDWPETAQPGGIR